MQKSGRDGVRWTEVVVAVRLDSLCCVSIRRVSRTDRRLLRLCLDCRRECRWIWN